MNTGTAPEVEIYEESVGRARQAKMARGKGRER